MYTWRLVDRGDTLCCHSESNRNKQLRGLIPEVQRRPSRFLEQTKWVTKGKQDGSNNIWGKNLQVSNYKMYYPITKMGVISKSLSENYFCINLLNMFVYST